MKRSKPLRTRTPLRRTTRLRARSKTNSYRKRERDFEFMGFVKRQPCIVRTMPPSDVHTFCRGRVEADHLGVRGMGQKANDRTCAPLCEGHHRERHDHAGTFRPLTKAELRDWRARAIEHTQTEWGNR